MKVAPCIFRQCSSWRAKYQLIHRCPTLRVHKNNWCQKVATPLARNRLSVLVSLLSNPDCFKACFERSDVGVELYYCDSSVSSYGFFGFSYHQIFVDSKASVESGEKVPDSTKVPVQQNRTVVRFPGLSKNVLVSAAQDRAARFFFLSLLFKEIISVTMAYPIRNVCVFFWNEPCKWLLNIDRCR